MRRTSTPSLATYSTGRDGSLYSIGRDANGNPSAKPVLGIVDGKPYQGQVLGRATGSGVAAEGHRADQELQIPDRSTRRR